MKMQDKLRLCRRILKQKPGNMFGHAERELALALPAGDEMNDMMRANLRELVLVFASQGHSGFSAGYAASLLDPLLRFKPLLPLQGDESEWTVLDYGGEMAAQNNRCSHVFRRADGTAYDSSGRVFEEPNGARYTGAGSQVEIDFPYTPKVEIVKVDEEGQPIHV